MKNETYRAKTAWNDAKAAIVGVGSSSASDDILHDMPAQTPSQWPKAVDTHFQLRVIAENLPLILWALDRQGVVTLSEGKGLEALGLKPGEAVGQHAPEMYGEHPEVVSLLAKALRGDEITATIRLGKSAFEVSCSPLRDPDGELAGTIGMAIDVTRRVCAEQALQQARANLERRVHRRTKELSAANQRLEREVARRKCAQTALEAQQQSLQYLLHAHERDRQLTACEIHDGLSQQITAASMRLDTYCATRLPPTGEAQEELQSILGHLRCAADEARRLIGRLHPPVIDKLGVLAAIQYLVDQHRHDDGIDIRFVHDVPFPRLAPLLEANIFRVVQEALNNIRQHSQATSAQVRLQQVDGRIQVEVCDSGRGFDQSKVKKDRFGLRGIRQRTELLGGSASIDSVPGRGTRVFVDLPLASAVP